jgi:hypothetical protein
MREPARNREIGQRLTREELAPSAGFGRMAEIGALATAASAMAIGTLEAAEPKMPPQDEAAKIVRPQSGSAEQKTSAHDGITAGGLEPHGAAGASSGATRAGTVPEAGHATPADMLMDPAALTARIAEQIASSVSHVLDMASGGDGTPATLSRGIVERAQDIAQEVHSQVTAREPLAVLAELVPPAASLDTLGHDIIQSVDKTLTKSGVMDLLQGVTAIADPDKILGDIVSDLHGLKLPVDVGALVSEPLDAVTSITQSVLGGEDQGENPLVDLFYDDGGADAVLSGIGETAGGLTDLVTEIPEIGFLGQPLDLGEALGGLTHGHNALGVL